MDMVVMIHTPHRDKKQGTIRSMEVCAEHGISPNKVIIDHNNEETVQSVLDRGYWAAFTIYPKTKMGNERMVEVVKQYGSGRIIVDSSADWGYSDPLAVPKTANLMKTRGVSEEDIRLVTYQNAYDAYSQSGQMKESDWLNASKVDQRELYSGNSVLRGQAPCVSGSTSDVIEYYLRRFRHTQCSHNNHGYFKVEKSVRQRTNVFKTKHADASGDHQDKRRNKREH
jgi:hypothetical protein